LIESLRNIFAVPELRNRVLYTFALLGADGSPAHVRRIVEEHGGQITFESEEGKGTRFLILLPVDPEKRSTLKSMVAVDQHWQRGETE